MPLQAVSTSRAVFTGQLMPTVRCSMRSTKKSNWVGVDGRQCWLDFVLLCCLCIERPGVLHPRDTVDWRCARVARGCSHSAAHCHYTTTRHAMGSLRSSLPFTALSDPRNMVCFVRLVTPAPSWFFFCWFLCGASHTDYLAVGFSVYAVCML